MSMTIEAAAAAADSGLDDGRSWPVADPRIYLREFDGEFESSDDTRGFRLSIARVHVAR